MKYQEPISTIDKNTTLSIKRSIREKHKQKLKETLRQHQKSLIAIAFNILGNMDDAKDALQRTLEKFAIKSDIELVKIPSFFRYLAKSMRNTALTMLATKKKKAEREEKIIAKLQTNPPPLSRRRIKNLLLQLLNKLKEELNEKQFRVLFLWAHGYTYTDIADDIQESEGAVRGLLQRAKKKAQNLKEWAKEVK